MFGGYNNPFETNPLVLRSLLAPVRTVDQVFFEFHDSINITGDQREICSSRRDSIIAYLKKDFHIVEAFASGSIPKYTANRGYADLDVIVALHYGQHCKDRLPSQVLQSVRNALSGYKTGSRKNGQAVTLYYDTWPNVDVVPAFQTGDDYGNVLYYNIPDMNTQTWIRSNPKMHSAAIKERASTYGAEFRKIIKMVKWWNRKHSSYLQSYHIEVLALQSLTSSFTNFPLEMSIFFRKACESLESSFLGLPSLQYLDSYVDGYLTISDREEALKRVRSARDLSLEAWGATFGNPPNQQRAMALWRQMFGEKFPSS